MDDRIYPGAYAPLELEPIFEFERRWADRDGAKDAAIRAAFGVSAATYWQALDRILTDPAEQRAALEHDAFTTNRLLRLTQARTRARAERTFIRS